MMTNLTTTPKPCTGINDILLGLPATPLNNTASAGTVLVIYGQRQFASQVIDTAQLNGPSEVSRYQSVSNIQKEENGISASFVGDVNGDGIVDFIFGAVGADHFNGRVYLIYGVPASPSPSLSPSPCCA